MRPIRGLAIEAATDKFSLAACDNQRRVRWEARPARDETQRVFEHAERLLARLGMGFKDLSFVAFGCGPGSFTGVRVAAAAAQSIAFAGSIPVCRVSSLAILANGAARALDAALIATCVDARMKRCYVALYRAVGAGGVEAALADAWINPEEFVIAGTEKFAAVGDGWLAYPDFLARHRARIDVLEPQLLPSAADLLGMAIRDFQAGRTVDAHDALPEYLNQRPAGASDNAPPPGHQR